MNIEKWFWCMAMVFLFIGLMPSVVRADMGPKPSVTITIEGCEEETYYATLLVADPYEGGPDYDVFDGVTSRTPADEGYDIWEAFVTYKDSDGYYYLQRHWKCSGNGEFEWGYCPPSKFKILLYFPEEDVFVVSESYERYAFRAYYTVDLSEIQISQGEVYGQLQVQKSYRFFWELCSLVLRLICTILVEYLIARCFFRMKTTLHILVMVNCITQLLLNVWLNMVDYHGGFLAQYWAYILAEFWVFVIESVIYTVIFVRAHCQKRQIVRVILYAFIANLASFAVGMFVMRIIENMSYQYEDLFVKTNGVKFMQ